MRFGKSQVDIAKLLSKVSPIYQNLLQKDIQRIPLFKDGYNALVLFLNNYAYERQGAAKAYPKIAVRCVSNKYKNPSNWTCPTKDDAECLWTEYQKIASEDYNLKVNEKRNPMNENDGVISRLASNGISNIADYVKNRMNCGKTTEAHNFLKSIRGIGEKIASFLFAGYCLLGRFR